MIIVILEKGRKLQDIEDPIVLSGIGRLLRENPQQTVVNFEDLVTSGLLNLPSNEPVSMYISVRGHALPGIMENWVVADAKSKVSESEVAIDGVLIRALAPYAPRISDVTICSCSAGVASHSRSSIQSGVLKALQTIGVEKNVRVTAYNGATISPPDPHDTMVVVYPPDDVRRPLKYIERANQIQRGINGKKHTGISEVEKYLASMDGLSDIKERALEVNKILATTPDSDYKNEPFFTAFIRYAVREAGAELTTDPINRKTVAQFIEEEEKEETSSNQATIQEILRERVEAGVGYKKQKWMQHNSQPQDKVVVKPDAAEDDPALKEIAQARRHPGLL